MKSMLTNTPKINQKEYTPFGHRPRKHLTGVGVINRGISSNFVITSALMQDPPPVPRPQLMINDHVSQSILPNICS
jgi:hypothetical protein